jgi:hypothetical protein
VALNEIGELLMLGNCTLALDVISASRKGISIEIWSKPVKSSHTSDPISTAYRVAFEVHVLDPGNTPKAKRPTQPSSLTPLPPPALALKLHG